MRTLGSFLMLLVVAACGSSTTPSEPAPVTTAAPITVAADVTTPPAQTTASHVKLGFAFTANLLGELEPCG